jgi:hypothetical protein
LEEITLTFSKFPLPKELLSPQPHYLSCTYNSKKLRVCFYMEKFPAHTFTSRETFSLYQPPLKSQIILRYILCNIDKIGLQILQVHTPSNFINVANGQRRGGGCTLFLAGEPLEEV